MGVFDEVAGLGDVARQLDEAGVTMREKTQSEQDADASKRRNGMLQTAFDWLSVGPLAAVITPREVSEASQEAIKTAEAVARSPEQAKEAVSTAKIVGFGALAVGAIVGVGYAASSLAKLVR